MYTFIKTLARSIAIALAILYIIVALCRCALAEELHDRVPERHSVPEPSTLAVLGTGAAITAFLTRRRRK